MNCLYTQVMSLSLQPGLVFVCALDLCSCPKIIKTQPDTLLYWETRFFIHSKMPQKLCWQLRAFAALLVKNVLE